MAKLQPMVRLDYQIMSACIIAAICSILLSECFKLAQRATKVIGNSSSTVSLSSILQHLKNVICMFINKQKFCHLQQSHGSKMTTESVAHT